MSVVIKLTDRAHYDLQEIQDYSIQRWGKRTADRYLKDIQTALSLLQDQPELLRHKLEISPHLKFYRVREHFLVCIEMKRAIIVLTIKHGQMDLPTRISELEPTLVQEADFLHNRLLAAQRKPPASSRKK
ncbi:MAG: type II toxin-antitoxin system RelE/ParE family toxin [Nitrospirales bacterium]|nr:type II toxin-antitoxin system RelE/ParE family toxin [Nitrospira sp.]MDR4502918.1 type II toxin-antitoxin system RelE/ParE family toxin [Nitrospirales bacterium]